MHSQVFAVSFILLTGAAVTPLATAQEAAAIEEEAVAEAETIAPDTDATKSAATAVGQQSAEAVTTANETADERAKTDAALQAQLDAQAAMIASQSSTNQQLNRALAEFQQTLEKQQEIIKTQEQQLQTTTEALTNLQSQIDQVKVDNNKALSEDDVAMRQRLEKLETQVSGIPTDPATMLADETFPGAIRVPGTTASYKFGGFVKGVLVKNFNPLVTQDRFIPGSIPVTTNDEQALASETSLTANQSRFNFDYRQRSELGNVRAFIEGDFAGSGNTLRLRHAFGQFRDLLAGKTWSAFYDAEASPEQVDFEGINGRVVVRQTQIRYFPQIGKDLRWMISLEDPQPEVTNGTGVSDLPDLVTSIRREWFGRYHIKTALLLRQIRAVANAGYDPNTGEACVPAIPPDPAASCQDIPTAGSTESDIGWAVTISGKIPVRAWAESDNLMFQLNFGKGLGRYMTDLTSVFDLGVDGGQDGVIDPTTGKLEALPVIGGYISFQHWWGKTVRSTFVASMVNVDNRPGQFDTAYHRTERLSGNLIWSPTKSVDLGGEFLWGRRTNNERYTTGAAADGTKSGAAIQLQMEAVYRF